MTSCSETASDTRAAAYLCSTARWRSTSPGAVEDRSLQIRLGGSSVTQPGPGAVQGHEGVLHDFFRGSDVADDPRGEANERLVVRAVQLPEPRIRIRGSRASDHSGVAGDNRHRVHLPPFAMSCGLGSRQDPGLGSESVLAGRNVETGEDSGDGGRAPRDIQLDDAGVTGAIHHGELAARVHGVTRARRKSADGPLIEDGWPPERTPPLPQQRIPAAGKGKSGRGLAMRGESASVALVRQTRCRCAQRNLRTWHASAKFARMR